MIAKNLLWLTIAYVLCNVLNALSSLLLPRLLGPQEFGQYTYVLWLNGWLGLISQVGLPSAVRKFIADLYSVGRVARAKQLVGRLVSLQTLLCLLGTGMMLVYITVSIHDAAIRTLAILAAISVAPSAISCIYANALNGMELVHATSKVTAVLGVLTIAATLAVLLTGGQAFGILSVLLASNLVYLIVTVIVYRRCMSHKTDAGEIRAANLTGPITAYCVGAAAAGFCTNVALDRSEIYFLQLYSGVRDVAMYGLAFSLAQKLLVIPQGISGALIPSFAQRASRGEHSSAFDLYSGSVRAYFLTITPFALLFATQAPFLIKLLYGAQYMPACLAFSIAMLTVPASAFSVPAFSVIYAIKGVTRGAIAVMLVPVALDIILSMLLIPRLSVVGAALANLITQWAMAIVLTIYVARVYNFRFALQQTRPVLLASAAAALTAAAVTQLLGIKFGAAALGLGAFVCLLTLRQFNAFAGKEFQVLLHYADKAPGKLAEFVRVFLLWLYRSTPAPLDKPTLGCAHEPDKLPVLAGSKES